MPVQPSHGVLVRLPHLEVRRFPDPSTCYTCARPYDFTTRIRSVRDIAVHNISAARLDRRRLAHLVVLIRSESFHLCAPGE
jgi:hypothetical protein